MTREARFWSHVDTSGECWLWRGALTVKGYGRVRWGNRFTRAHRVAFYLAHLRWPDGDVDHMCHTHACVRPEHLRDLPASINRSLGVLYRWELVRGC